MKIISQPEHFFFMSTRLEVKCTKNVEKVSIRTKSEKLLMSQDRDKNHNQINGHLEFTNTDNVKP